MLLFYTCNADCSACSIASATIQEQYDKLIGLPVDDLLPSLLSNKVVTFNQKVDIDELPQKKRKMKFILDLIISSLEKKIPVLYNGFLKVMKESDDLVVLELTKKLGKLKHL